MMKGIINAYSTAKVATIASGFCLYETVITGKKGTNVHAYKSLCYKGILHSV